MRKRGRGRITRVEKARATRKYFSQPGENSRQLRRLLSIVPVLDLIEDNHLKRFYVERHRG